MRERTLAQLAQEAVDVQDACNLSGVVHAWSRSVSRLRELLPSAGTDEINRHPVNVLFASKLGDLTGIGGGELTAYDACQEMAKGDK